MAQYLLGTYELEQQLEALIAHHQVYPDSSEVTDAIHRLVNSYNRTQDELLLDDLIDVWQDRLDNYTSAELIVEHFLSLVHGRVDTRVYVARLNYYPVDEVIIVSECPKSAIDPVTHLKDTYQHATMQGDYYPERMRRALAELDACL